MPEQRTLELVQSFTRVRLALGLLGLALPVILFVGGMMDEPRPGGGMEPTISHFYHTTYRDIFVGALCAIGVFLISYRGYPRSQGEWINDDWLATMAGVSAFGLAFFPNEGGGNALVTVAQRVVGPEQAPMYHYSFALTFFLSLAGFCFFKFAKTTSRRRWWVYMCCGTGIMLALVLTAVAVYFKEIVQGAAGAFVERSSLIFYLEALGVWAFAISWITKSRADQKMTDRLRRRLSGARRD